MFAARNVMMTTGKKANPALKGIAGGDLYPQIGTVSIPSHAVGDLIFIVAWGIGFVPNAPAAGGTVPTWTTIGSPSGDLRMAYAIATATNHTSGTWSSTNGVAAAVISDPGATPIGGYAYTTQQYSQTVTAPAITLSNSSGTSVILHISFSEAAPSGSSTPSGYTKVLDYTGSYNGTGIRALTKNVTTSDGAVTTMSGYPSSRTNDSISVEFLA